MKAIDGVIYICQCALHREIPDKQRLLQLDLDAVYRESARHMLAAMVGMTLKEAGITTSLFKQAIAAAQRKTIVLNHEMAAVFRELDQSGIWHMALKGAVLRDWYPKFGMRESSDCDILFDKTREEDVRSIMVSLGYSVESYGKGHHDVYMKKPLTNMQMHVDLFGPGYDRCLNDYFENIKEKLVLKAGTEYVFTPEDFYIYILAHEWDHYKKAGTGLRSLVDVYVFEKKYGQTLDRTYIREEVRKLGIERFEENNRLLAMRLFGGKELNEEDQEILSYILASGTYGTVDHRIGNFLKKNGKGLRGKIRYILSRIFLPMDVIQFRYPFFYKHKILFPFLPIYRVVSALSKKKAHAELKTLLRYEEKGVDR